MIDNDLKLEAFLPLMFINRVLDRLGVSDDLTTRKHLSYRIMDSKPFHNLWKNRLDENGMFSPYGFQRKLMKIVLPYLQKIK